MNPVFSALIFKLDVVEFDFYKWHYEVAKQKITLER